jgi:hypothetical protein
MKKKRFKNTYEYEEWAYAKTAETNSISIEYFSGDNSIKIMEAIPDSL